MGTATAIAWTDHTFNPWWGCARVSPGCQNCYAEALAKRYGHDVWGKGSDRRRLSDKHWAEPLKWDRLAEKAGQPALVFCASMADVFEDRDDHHDDRTRLFELIENTPHLIWQLLTKRPENVDRLIPFRWFHSQWPSNVWLGTTVEDQQRADERVPVLLGTGARVRFLSCEPLLGPLDLSRWLHLEWMDALGDPERPSSFRGEGGWGREMFAFLAGEQPGLHWVIVGGESGPGHRPLDLAHARDLVNQVEAAGVPAFFKQVGGHRATTGGDELDGRRLKQFPPEARRAGSAFSTTNEAT